MFNSPSGFSLQELKKGRKLYLTNQSRFFRDNTLQTKWRVHRTSLKGFPCRVPDTMDDGVLLRCRNVRVVTERQFVHDDTHFYAYGDIPGFNSFRWLLPHYSFYDVDVKKAFVSFGYCHNNYYHDIIEYLFQGYLLSEMKITDTPLLWMGMPSAVQTELFEIFNRRGIDFVCVPGKLSRVRVGEAWALPDSHARIARRPWNYTGALFDWFSAYRSMLMSEVASSNTDIKLPEKIFSTRTFEYRRTPANNAEFEQYFSSLGYELIDFGKYSFAEQVMLAQNADEIVGMHGANLTNIMFMNKGSRVVELMPKKKESDDAYKRLSNIFGLEYQRLPLIKTGPVGYDMDSISQHF